MSALATPARGRVARMPSRGRAALQRARLTVVPRRRVRAARVPFVALVSLLLVGGVAGLLFFNTSMQQASFHASALARQAQQLNAERQSLQMDLARERDPQTLAVRARAMGMVPPVGPAFLRLSDGKVLGSPAPAVPADGFRVRQLPTRKPAILRPAPVILKAPGAANHGAKTAAGTKRTDTKTNGHTATQPGSTR